MQERRLRLNDNERKWKQNNRRIFLICSKKRKSDEGNKKREREAKGLSINREKMFGFERQGRGILCNYYKPTCLRRKKTEEDADMKQKQKKKKKKKKKKNRAALQKMQWFCYRDDQF